MQLPIYKGWPVVGVLPAFARDPVSLFLKAAKEVGPLARLAISSSGRKGPIMVAHPQDLAQILKDNSKNYIRGHTVDKIRPLLGNGLPLADGDFWLRHRRLMQPSFSKAKVGEMVATMVTVAARHLDRLADGQRLLAHDLMRDIAQEVIVATMFSDSLRQDLAELDEALTSVEEYVARWGFLPFSAPRFLPSARRFARAVGTIDKVLAKIIGARRSQNPGAFGDLLAGLLSAREREDDKGLTDQELRDEVVNIFFAGHETTANALTWAVYLLSTHEEAHKTLCAEVERVLGGRLPTATDLPSLPYANAVLRETLRLYPSAWIFAREAVAEDSLRGVPIPKGSVLLLSPMVTHRMAENFPDPQRFEPERFLKDPRLGLGGTGDFTYLPFGGGPHQCIGNHFAMAEAQVVLALLCQRGRLVVGTPEEVRPRAGATLMVASGLPVQFEKTTRRAALGETH